MAPLAKYTVCLTQVLYIDSKLVIDNLSISTIGLAISIAAIPCWRHVPHTIIHTKHDNNIQHNNIQHNTTQ